MIKPWLIAAASLVASQGVTWPATADTCSDRVSLGPEGEISAFLVTEPSRAEIAAAAARLNPLSQMAVTELTASSRTAVGPLRVMTGDSWTRLPSTQHAAVAYRLLVLESDAATIAYLATGGHGGIDVRLNGELILTRSVHRRGDEDTELAKLTLRPGANLLFLRLHSNKPGPWHVFARLLGPGLGGPPPGVVARIPGWCAPTNEKPLTRTRNQEQPPADGCAPSALRRCRVSNLSGRAQVLRLFHRSRVDGQLHPYALYVPPGYRAEGSTAYPLVVALHGLGGRPLAFLKTSLGIVREKKLPPEAFEQLPANLPTLGVFVLAPEGMGSSGYRTYGETEVLEALADTLSRFHIDRDRISITGVSMGGSGTALIGLRHAELFSTAAPLGGYHDIRLFDDIKSARLLPWEQHLVEVWSSSEWAANGRHLPLKVVHGLRDGPSQSNALVKAYRQRSYRETFTTPDLGHNVWDLTYADGRFVRELAFQPRASHPRFVSLRTTASGPTRSHWIRLDRAPRYDQWTELEGNWREAGIVSVRTRNASALTIARDAVLSGHGLVAFELDGQRIEARDCPPVADPLDQSDEPPGPPLPRFGDAVHLFHRLGDNWRCAPAPPCEVSCKRPPLAGPIPEAFAKPLLFVYGTADPQEEHLTRRLAHRLAQPRPNITLSLPIKADRDVTEEDLRTHSLALVGTVQGNLLLARVKSQLAIDVRPGEVMGRTFWHRGDALSVVFIQRSPFAEDQYLLVYTGTGPAGLFHTPHLPQILPDYVIYDATSWPFTGGRVLRDRRVLEGGFFDSQWQLPPRPLPQNPYLAATPK